VHLRMPARTRRFHCNKRAHYQVWTRRSTFPRRRKPVQWNSRAIPCACSCAVGIEMGFQRRYAGLRAMRLPQVQVQSVCPCRSVPRSSDHVCSQEGGEWLGARASRHVLYLSLSTGARHRQQVKWVMDGPLYQDTPRFGSIRLDSLPLATNVADEDARHRVHPPTSPGQVSPL
jgi:hypothetical protein